MISVARSVKPLLFHMFGGPIYKTMCFFIDFGGPIYKTYLCFYDFGG